MSTRIVPWIAALLLFACSREGGDFAVVDVRPRPQDGPLKLNQPVTILFSERVDPSSVTPESIALRGPDGRTAEGTLATDGSRVVFTPRPVGAETLDDGGYAPGREVALSLSGFPGRKGPLSAAGEPLAGAFRADYRVTSSRELSAFVDTEPGKAPVLLNAAGLGGADALEVHPEGSVCLRFSEPLYPPSVRRAIRLIFDNADRTPVAAEVALKQTERGAEVSVRPLGGFRSGTRYLLIVQQGALVDLGGTPCEDVRPLRLAATETGARCAGCEGAGGGAPDGAH